MIVVALRVLWSLAYDDGHVQIIANVSVHLSWPSCLLQVEPKVQKLYDYIRERGTILPINDYNQELLMQDDVQKRVAESIRSGECCHSAHMVFLLCLCGGG